MLIEVGGHGVTITGFVFIMMLVIEYLNVLTRGRWDRMIGRWKWGQSVFSSLLGAMPGCLGAFAVVSLYAHRVLTFGALTAAMVATCGDEAFVMIALFPEKALMIIGYLFVLGICSGIAVDLVLGFRRTSVDGHLDTYRPAHRDKAECIPFSRGDLLRQWRECSPHRGWLTVLLVLFMAGVISGKIGHHHMGVEAHGHIAASEEHAVGVSEHEHPPSPRLRRAGEHEDGEEMHHRDGGRWTWVRITLLVLSGLGLAVVATVPDHFLDEHLWNHLVRVHLWRIMLWTIGALLVTRFLVSRFDIEAVIASHRLPILLLACLVGLVPESGPHLIFVTLYAEGAVPLSIFLASCVVQDGHGMIPVLAHSPRAFLAVKTVNFVLGLSVGLLGYMLGW